MFLIYSNNNTVVEDADFNQFTPLKLSCTIGYPSTKVIFGNKLYYDKGIKTTMSYLNHWEKESKNETN